MDSFELFCCNARMSKQCTLGYTSHVASSHVAIEKISLNIERTSGIDWDSTMAAQRFYCVSSQTDGV